MRWGLTRFCWVFFRIQPFPHFVPFGQSPPSVESLAEMLAAHIHSGAEITPQSSQHDTQMNNGWNTSLIAPSAIPEADPAVGALALECSISLCKRSLAEMPTVYIHSRAEIATQTPHLDIQMMGEWNASLITPSPAPEGVLPRGALVLGHCSSLHMAFSAKISTLYTHPDHSGMEILPCLEI